MNGGRFRRVTDKTSITPIPRAMPGAKRKRKATDGPRSFGPGGKHWWAYAKRLENAQDRRGAIGSILVTGPRGSFGTEAVYEHESNDVEYTAKEVERTRHILMTEARSKELDEGYRFSGGGMRTFGRSDGTEIIEHLPCEVAACMHLYPTMPEKFDALLGLTYALIDNDTWLNMHYDHSEDGALQKALDWMYEAWNTLLNYSDRALGIDGEFTRRGVRTMLCKLIAKLIGEDILEEEVDYVPLMRDLVSTRRASNKEK